MPAGNRLRPHQRQPHLRPPVGEEEIAGQGTDAITEADIAAGRWDGAGIEVWRVDWTNLDNHLLLRTGTIGEITAADGGFRAEVRGLAFLLDQAVRTAVPALLRRRLRRWPLHAGRCRLDEHGHGRSRFDGARDLAQRGGCPRRWLVLGRAAHRHGPVCSRVPAPSFNDSHLSDDLGARLQVRQALSEVPAPGTALQLVAGCDKRFETCRDRFANAVNFRGFFMPGRDFVFSYASGDGDDDGEVLF